MQVRETDWDKKREAHKDVQLKMIDDLIFPPAEEETTSWKS